MSKSEIERAEQEDLNSLNLSAYWEAKAAAEAGYESFSQYQAREPQKAEAAVKALKEMGAASRVAVEEKAKEAMAEETAARAEKPDNTKRPRSAGKKRKKKRKTKSRKPTKKRRKKRKSTRKK